MFDRLDDLLIRYEELMEELGSPEVASDTNRFRKLMKEQSDLAPIVEAYKEYKKAKQDVEDSLALLDEESDEEMREMAKEELNAAKKRIEDLEQELKIAASSEKIRTMKRTLSSRSVQVQAAMRRHYLRPNCTVCMCALQSATAGKLSLSASVKMESAASRRSFS